MSKYDERTELADARAHEAEHLEDMANQTWRLRARRAEQRLAEVEKERDEAQRRETTALMRSNDWRAVAEAAEKERDAARAALLCLVENVETAWPSLAHLGPIANARAVLSDHQTEEVQGKVKLGSNSETGGE